MISYRCDECKDYKQLSRSIWLLAIVKEVVAMRWIKHVIMGFLLGVVMMACDGTDENMNGGAAEPFSLQVIPQQMSPTVPGQRCVLLVTVAEEGSIPGEKVTVSVSAPGAVATVEPLEVGSDEVAEVTLIPDEASVDHTLTVIVEGERRGFTDTEEMTIEVTDAGIGGGTGDDLAVPAAEFRDRFVTWLAENQPDLGITPETE